MFLPAFFCVNHYSNPVTQHFTHVSFPLLLSASSQAYRLGADELLLLGREGMLYSGPASGRHEAVLMNYLYILNIEKFVRNFYQRMFILDDRIDTIRELIENFRHDPSNIVKYRTMLNESHHTIILLDECMAYVQRSLQRLVIVSKPTDEAGDRLFHVLNMKNTKRDISLRVSDLAKLVQSGAQKLEILQLFSTSVTKRLLETTVIKINDNYRSLVDASKADERAGVATEIMNLIFSGSFLFDIIDRLSGDDMLGGNGVDGGTPPPHHMPQNETRTVSWVNDYLRNTIIVLPMMWILSNLLWLGLGCWILNKYMQLLLSKTLGAMSCRFTLNVKIDLDLLVEYLDKRTATLVTCDNEIVGQQHITKIAWGETDTKLWGGEPPKIALQYDSNIKFILSAQFQWNMHRLAKDKLEVLKTWQDDLVAQGIMGEKETIEYRREHIEEIVKISAPCIE